MARSGLDQDSRLGQTITVSAPQSLPVDEELPAIVAELSTSQYLVLQADPGAGKTTRVPVALEQHLAPTAPGRCRVLISEPRRVAARLAAARVAEEVGCQLGAHVGYSVRFEERRSEQTRVHFMTEGVLLRQVLRPGGLDDVKAVIVDEFHERHLETDLLLTLLKRACQGPTGPKLVIMSATLDGEELSAFLGCRAIHARGRAFPLVIRHEPTASGLPLERLVAAAVRTAVAEEIAGNILVFLPGTREIRATSKLLERGLPRDVRVLPLHGQLPLREQALAIGDSSSRKVVLATNVAESSVTVSGVTCVIDSGLERRAFDSPWGGHRRLDIAPISQNSATQRAGRAGRTGPGRVIRLYSAADLQARPAADKPEVQRLELSAFLLAIASHGLDKAQLTWLTPPPPESVATALSQLTRLGALDGDGSPTATGHQLAQLPLSPRLGRLLLECVAQNIDELGALAAALLSERDIRSGFSSDLPSGKSDLQERIDAYREAEAEDFRPGALRAIGLEGPRVREVKQVYERLRALARGLAPGVAKAAPVSGFEEAERRLRRALLTAYSDCAAQRRKNNRQDFVLRDGLTARLDDSSVVAEAQFVVALDSAERSRLDLRPGPRAVLRWVSAIEGDWLVDAGGPDLQTKETLEFNRGRGQVESIEQLVYGSLVLDHTRSPAPPSPERARLLLEAAKTQKSAIFGKRSDTDSLLARLAFFRSQTTEAASAPETLTDLLLLGCENCSSIEELSQLDWAAHLLGSLSAKDRAALSTIAPTEVVLTGGRRVPVHYERDKAPWIASRIQDFFGMPNGPTLGPARHPVTLHLLAPNGRAAQVTQDLAGFWQRHYPEVRKELRRRYARHHWPEDGRDATPRPAAKTR